jgi:hypothetical protein
MQRPYLLFLDKLRGSLSGHRYPWQGTEDQNIRTVVNHIREERVSARHPRTSFSLRVFVFVCIQRVYQNNSQAIPTARDSGGASDSPSLTGPKKVKRSYSVEDIGKHIHNAVAFARQSMA